MGAAADPWLHPPMPWPRRSLPKTFMCPPELVAFLFVDDCGHDHLPGRERCRHSQSLYLRRTYKSLRSRLMAQPLPRALRHSVKPPTRRRSRGSSARSATRSLRALPAPPHPATGCAASRRSGGVAAERSADHGRESRCSGSRGSSARRVRRLRRRFELSARNARLHRQRGTKPRCRRCTYGHQEPKVTQAMRDW